MITKEIVTFSRLNELMRACIYAFIALILYLLSTNRNLMHSSLFSPVEMECFPP
jgi:hypothetical protein